MAHFGLEHHESSDDRTDEEALIDEDHRRIAAGLLPHEFVHSWNGKFRRPAGLATADYNEPMKGESALGLRRADGISGRDSDAAQRPFDTAGFLRFAGARKPPRSIAKTGRTWRPLEDTAVAAQILYGSRADYRDLRRAVDYYEEGTLIWLDADVTIRTLSKGREIAGRFLQAVGGRAGHARPR